MDSKNGGDTNSIEEPKPGTEATDLQNETPADSAPAKDLQNETPADSAPATDGEAPEHHEGDSPQGLGAESDSQEQCLDDDGQAHSPDGGTPDHSADDVSEGQCEGDDKQSHEDGDGSEAQVDCETPDKGEEEDSPSQDDDMPEPAVDDGAQSQDEDSIADDSQQEGDGEESVSADEGQPGILVDQQAPALTTRPEYSMRDFGLVCICCEFMWFFGSKWAISMLAVLGINAITAQYVVAVLWFPLTMFAIPYAYMRIKGLDSEKFVGLCGRIKIVDMLVVGLASFAVWAMLRLPEMYWSQLIDYIFGSNVPRIGGIGAYDTVFIIDFIRKCIVPSFFEEYLYRGILYRSLRGGIGAGRAAILSSVIFMLMHTDLKNILAPIALGLLCCYLLEITGSLYPCMLSHFIYNCSSTIGNLSIASRGSGMESGWRADLPVTLIMVVSCTALLIMCLHMIHKDGRYESSVSIGEYAVCKRSRFDLLPFFILCIMLVAGYFF